MSLFLTWNLLGVFHYLTSVNASIGNLISQGMTAVQAEVFYNTPSYHYAVFALSVWSGFLGSVLLILRKSWSIPVFLFSVGMTIISFIFDAVSGNLSILGSGYFTLMLALFQAWYSNHMKVRSILH